MIMNPIEERVDHILGNKIEETLEKFVDRSLRDKIYDRAKEIIATKDFAQDILTEFRLMRDEDWFVDCLIESAQRILDERLLPHIEERVELNLENNEIESLIVEKKAPAIEKALEHPDVQDLLDRAVLQSIRRKVRSPQIAHTIEAMVHDAFQRSLDRFSTNILSKRSDDL